MKHHWKKKGLAAAAAALLLTVGITALAAAGTSENPLVTLSYLTDTFTNAVLSQTNTEIASAQATCERNLDAKISALQTGSGSAGTGAFSVVSLKQGQVLTGSVGCEVMLRIGTAVCVSDGATGLIDTTTGGTLSGGSGLEQNHLYLVSINTRGVQAATAGKVLVRGPYTLS